MPVAAPRTLGRYLILDELGRGGATVSYLAQDPALDREVVVKVVALPTELPEAERSAFEARFLDEARRASRVSHLGLVATHDCGRDESTGIVYAVQEHVEGPSLAQALAPGEARPWEEALRLVAGIGHALQELHAAGLVHGGVRPRNVLLPSGGTARLADPGVARLEASRITRISLEQAFGQPLYTSPEQAVGERVDPRSDVFALGAVAYRLLTGRDAFAAADPQRVLARVVHDRPAPPSTLVPALPRGIDDVLAKALAKARKDRYATAAELCDDVDDLLAGRPPRHAEHAAAKPDTSRFLAAAHAASEAGNITSPASARTARRSKRRVATGLLALGLVAGLELLRREWEAPDAAPAGRPAPELERHADAGPSLEVPELPAFEAPAPSARLAIDFRHTLERGTLIVSVDGVKVLERRVTGAVKKSLLGIKLREGRVSQVVELPPGRHHVTVRVLWSDDARVGKLAGDFPTGATRRLSAKLARLGKSLSVKWE